MNSNERTILDILAKHPLASQNDIADALGITRSSVSVYISHLIQEGYILGRGYLLNKKERIYVIGSAIVDYYTVFPVDAFQEDGTMILDDVEFSVSYGGYAKNLTENLLKLDDNTACIFAIGDDTNGRELLEECRTYGMDVDDILVVPGQKTSSYLEIRSPERNKILVSAVDGKLLRYMTPKFLAEKQHKLKNAQIVAVEDGIPEESLRYLSASFSNIVMVATKLRRAQRYAPFLNQFNGMVVSLQIACSLLGMEYDEDMQDDDVFAVTKALRQRISGPVLICYGKNGFCYCADERLMLSHYTSKSHNSGLYSHYRDCVAAGFIHCLAKGIYEEKLLSFVSACREVSSSMDIPNRGQTFCAELVETTMSNNDLMFTSRLLD